MINIATCCHYKDLDLQGDIQYVELSLPTSSTICSGDIHDHSPNSAFLGPITQQIDFFILPSEFKKKPERVCKFDEDEVIKSELRKLNDSINYCLCTKIYIPVLKANKQN